MIEKILDNNNLFGINYYHESMGYLQRDNLEIDQELEQIKERTNKIKLFKHPWGDVGYILNICQRAKEKGLYVIVGENLDGNLYPPPYSPYQTVKIDFKALSEETWPIYCEKVIADYIILKDYVDEFLVANEISIHTDKTEFLTSQNLINRCASLKDELAKIQKCTFGIQCGSWMYLYLGSNEISVEEVLLFAGTDDEEKIKSILAIKDDIAINKDPIDYSAFDKLYFTIYSEDEERFREVAKIMRGYYPDAGWGEWNVGFDKESVTEEEIKEKSEKIKIRKDWLKIQNIPNFIFTWGHDKFHKINDEIQSRVVRKMVHECRHDEGLPCSINYK